ncbi:non-ribosomal peptide synthetase [Streptomyces pactum]|uniref:Phenyloxazoline synthase MbtB n=1 Tax=Streptomyces pactum TaxID=68249 RepID=A0A1S6J3M6_9ACTN|nr:non-ribosomal peptide synthetase [Streptomyces pactum]AQS66341.1 non-ribosomal peptide synthase [Streptomyces pactum]
MAQELLSELRRRGIKLRLADGRLDIVAPAGSLTEELRDRLKGSRDELIALLRRSHTAEAGTGVVPRPDERYEPFPLTDIQHAYWVGRGSALDLGGVSTHLYFELERTGLEMERLTTSLRKVIARHDMLRAVIQPDGRQRILPEVPAYEIAVRDLRGLDEAGQQAGVEEIRATMDHQVLPTDRAPLFDIRACLLDGDRTRLHISIDVLILDGLSLFVLFGEWRRFYEDPRWDPEPLSLSYRDYVLHEEAARGGTRYKKDEEYWLRRLDTLPAAPELPLAVQPGQVARTEFTRRGGKLTRERWGALKEAARRRGVTPSAVLMTVFGDALRLWSARPDFTLNLTLFNRPSVHPQIDDVIGDFTTLTMLENRAQSGSAFADRVESLQAQLMRDLEHMSYNGVRVLRERTKRLGGGPSAAAMPVVFTSALVLGSADGDPADGIRFFGERVHGLTQTPQVWLDHQTSEEQGELLFNWDTVEALFPDGMLDDMFAVYCEALGRLVDEPELWETAGSPARLPEWQARERAAANDTAAELPGAASLCALVEEQARKSPDAVAVISETGELTYRETVWHARRLARRLGELGAAPDTLVGVVLDKGWEQVATVLGVQLSGAGYLPIEPGWPRARRDRLLDEAGARIVVTSPALRDEAGWPDGVRVVTLDDPEVAAASTDPLEVMPAGDHLAYVIYTSGSTGRPKGVAIDHRSAVNTILDMNARFRVGPGDAVLALSSLSFDLSVYDVFGLLAAGGSVVLPAPGRTQDPAHWTDLAERHGVTLWNSVPALMQAWVDSGSGGAEPPDSKLRLVLLSGDWIPVALPDAVRRRHGKAEVVSLGGATEAAIWSVCYPIGEVPANWSRIPYGKPLANQTLHVYDASFEPCPVWSTGEICIGGAGVARGYWGDPERTAERFVVHPRTGERLYRTGDLGRYLPGGDIEFLGREDLQVKVNGYRIELGEITSALLRQPGVADAVTGVDTNPQTGHRQLVAHVVPAVAAAAAATPRTQDGASAWQKAIEACEAGMRQGTVELAAQLAEYRHMLETLEDIAPTVMARTFARLGVFTSTADTASAADVVARCGIKPGYRQLVERWLSVLAAEGVLRAGAAPATYACTRPLDAEGLTDRLRDALAAAEFGGSEAVLRDYFAACVEQQVDMLRGRTSPLKLLLAGDKDKDRNLTDALYADNAVSVLQNSVLAQGVRAFVESRGGTGRPVRVLEVGAGTGATTAQVLKELPEDVVRYSFTDVSAYFTSHAKERFRHDARVEYAVFDIDREPAPQGVEPGSVDVVIAANVLHDAKDVQWSLTRLRSALAPGGLLVLLEGTVNSRQQMVTVGLIEALAQDHGGQRLPLLTVPQWQRHLEAAGFTRLAAVPGPDASVDFHGQQVLIGQAPDDAAGARPGPDRLRRGLEDLLPGYMVPRHVIVLDRLPLTPNGKVDRSALPSPWEEAPEDERVTPRNAVEQTVFAIWCEALGHDGFGVTEDFFDLGGDSLHAVTILGRLQEEFGLDDAEENGLDLLFDNPTIAELSEELAARRTA